MLRFALRGLSGSTSATAMRKPSMPKNPYSQFVKDNYKLVMESCPADTSSKEIQAQLKIKYDNLEEGITLEANKEYKLATKIYRLNLANFHNICAELSGTSKPVPPEMPTRTGYSVYNQERLQDVIASLPLDYKPIDLFKEQAINWKNEDESIKNDYNNMVADEWAAYKAAHAQFKLDLAKFESFGEPVPPKNAKTAYSVYAKDARPQIANDFPNLGHIGISKKIAESWKTESASVKEFYQNQVASDQSRYQAELEEYKLAKANFDTRMVNSGQSLPPKPKDNHYAAFIEEKLPEIKNGNPGIDKNGLVKILADLWKKLSKDEKEMYKNLHTEKQLDYAKRVRKLEEKEAEESGMKVVSW